MATLTDGAVVTPGGVWASSHADRRSTAREGNLLPFDLFALAALVALAMGALAPRGSTIAQMLLTFVAVMATDVRMLPAIILLQTTFTDFKGGIGAGMEGQYERFESLTINVAGFPITPNYVLTLAVAMRVLSSVMLEPARLHRRLSLWLLVPIVPMFALAVTNGLSSYRELEPGWSATMREVLQLLAMWYGVLVMTKPGAWDHLATILRSRISLLCLAALGLSFFSLFSNRLTWVLMACAVALGLQLLLARRGRNPLLAAPLLLLASFYGVGLKATGSARSKALEALGGFTSTLTTILIMAIPTALSLWQYARDATRRRPYSPQATWLLAASVFGAFVTVPFIVAWTTVGFAADIEGDTEQQSYRDRIVYKLLLERASLWRGAIDQINEPPYVFKIRRSRNYFITPSEKRVYVKYSSHNVILDYLRTQGWLVGGMSVAYAFLSFLIPLQTYFRSRFEDVVAVLAITSITIVIGSGFSGSAMTESAVSFVILLFVGICAVYNREFRDRESAIARRERPSTFFTDSLAPVPQPQ